MSTHPSPRRRLTGGLLVLSLVLAGCQAGTTEPTTTTTASQQSPSEIDQTWESLRRVDDLPLFELTFVGDYDSLAPPVRVNQPSPFGCSLFVAFGDPARPLFARNFDWETHPALLLHTDPPDGYASVSIVDIGYLGLAMNDDPTADRVARDKLLNAPLLPFDGLNEKGLAIGLAEDLVGSLRADPAKPTVSGVRIIRLVLDNAATVDEALDIFGRYNLDFSTGSPLHYLIADASGKSAVVEYIDGTLRVERGGPPWQALTNFRYVGSDQATRQADRRYSTAARALDAGGGKVEWPAAMRILQDVSQGHTRWSVTYDMKTGAVHVVTRKRWDVVHSFQLTMAP